MRPGRQEVVAGALVLLVVVGTLVGAVMYDRALAGARTIDLVGRGQRWSPEVITVQAGEKVRLRIRSDDVSHGFFIPDLGVSVSEIYPGKPAIVEFTPERTGEFTFMCTRFCGPNHGLMRGKIIVQGRSLDK